MPKAFDQLWAVVTYQSYGGGDRLLWSSEHQTWLLSLPYGAGFVSSPVDGFTGRPYDDEVAAVPRLADELLTRRICQHCCLSDLEDQFVAPDMFGDAAMYCVQRPHESVVSSFGGSGTRKHWGSLHACSAVKPRFLFVREWDEEEVDFGEGLVASHVRDWAWCDRCTNAARNIATAAEQASKSVEEFTREHQENLLERRARNRGSR